MADQVIRISGIERLLRRIPFNKARTEDAIEHGMNAASVYAQGQLQRRIPVRTGQTRGRISYRVTHQMDGWHGEVGGSSLSESGHNILKSLEEGTGLYGPHKQRIYPTHAKVLRWTSTRYRPGGAGGGARAQTTFHFAKSIAGMKPRRPFARTKEEAGKSIQRVFVRDFSAAFLKG